MAVQGSTRSADMQGEDALNDPELSEPLDVVVSDVVLKQVHYIFLFISHT